ncbi:MAG TPA: glycine betaine ABC transporter substrate-binding protein [Thermoanaerobaculia bacterium]
MRKFVVFLLLAAACSRESNRAPVVVSSKNFTESVILGELLAQQLEQAGCTVDRRLNMGGTMLVHNAMTTGAVDAYVEYSGTALTAILHKPTSQDRAEVDRVVKGEYSRLQLRYGPRLGFNNTFAMIVRKQDAQQHGLTKISDLSRVASTFRPGFGYEFVERPDGWPGLLTAYQLQFKNAPATMDLGLTYKALAAGQVDLIAGNSTDGLIDSLGLVVLEDDRRYFPPYDAAVVYRRAIDEKCRGASRSLEALGDRIDDAAMRRMNYAVDGEKKDVAAVVRQFLGR